MGDVSGCAVMMLVVMILAPITTAVIGPDGTTARPASPAGWVPPVLAKLNPAICNYKTGQISPTDLAQVQKQAAAAGLQYDRELPVNCWYKFKQTGNATRTAAAMAALTVPKSNKTGSVSTSSTGEPLPFALTEYDQLMVPMQPVTATQKPAAGAAVVQRPTDASIAAGRSGSRAVARPGDVPL